MSELTRVEGYKREIPKRENWSRRTIKFEMISDNRFDRNIKEKIKQLDRKVTSKLRDKTKFDLRKTKPQLYTARDGSGNQYRIQYYVRINKNKVRWKDLIEKVNSVKAPAYSF